LRHPAWKRSGANLKGKDKGQVTKKGKYISKTRDAWQSLTYSPLGAAVSSPSK